MSSIPTRSADGEYRVSIASSSRVSPASLSSSSPSLPATAQSPGSPTALTYTTTTTPRRLALRQSARKNPSLLDLSTLLSTRTRLSEWPDPRPAPPLLVEAKAPPHRSFPDWSSSPRGHRPVIIHHSPTHAPYNRDTRREHKAPEQSQQSTRGGPPPTKLVSELKTPAKLPSLLHKLGTATGSDALDISLSYPDRCLTWCKFFYQWSYYQLLNITNIFLLLLLKSTAIFLNRYFIVELFNIKLAYKINYSKLK